MPVSTLQKLFAGGGLLLGLVGAYYGLGPLSVVFPDSWIPLGALVAGPIILGILFYLAAPTLVASASQFTTWIEGRLSRAPVQDVVLGALGMILGLVIANLIRGSLIGIPIVGVLLPLLVALLLGYLGWSIAVKKREDLLAMFQGWRSGGQRGTAAASASESSSAAMVATVGTPTLKLLDTSAIIDGRIADVSATGFLEGKLIVPDFVLDELRHVADSADPLRRNRGRRGLDVLQRLQEQEGTQIEILGDSSYTDFEVDRRLVEMARRLNAAIFTTDFNLNKVARLHGVVALNLNELGNALKPVVLPGEKLELQIIRYGKEAGQGVGYLDDGTMVVVEGGRQHVGTTLMVVVTSVIQTAAGRMVFARQRESEERQPVAPLKVSRTL